MLAQVKKFFAHNIYSCQYMYDKVSLPTCSLRKREYVVLANPSPAMCKMTPSTVTVVNNM